MKERLDHPEFLTPMEWSKLATMLKLSNREKQIVVAILNGWDETRIGAALSISPHTVHTYVGRLYQKVGCNSRSEFITHVFQRYVSLCHEQSDATEFN